MNQNLSPQNQIRNIWAIGRNYGEHAKEMGYANPETPLVFLKAGSCALQSGHDLVLPSFSQNVHHEVELALQFDSDLKISRACVAIDLTARDTQEELKKKMQPWTLAKSFKNSCPLGSFFEVHSLEELNNLTLLLTVNGELKQKGNVQQMIFSPSVLVEHVLNRFPVVPGDLLLTGTPSGVGPLNDGDVVEISIPERSKGQWRCKRQ